MLNDFSTYECAKSLLKNAKYLQYIDYVIEHNDDIMGLYKNFIKLIENNQYTELTDEVVIEGMIDYTYKTEEKEFSNYIFKEVIGKTTGKFTEEEIEVTYVYEKITPPNTGVQLPGTNGIGYMNYILILLVGLVCKKRYN